MSNSFIIIACLILSAFFSGMEIAFISANRLRIELDKKQGLLSARIVDIFIKSPADFIATLLLANSIVLVIYGIVIAQILEPRIHLFVDNNLYVLILQTIFSTLLILVSAEFFPKIVFRLMPNFFLNFLSVPVLLFYILLYPISKAIIWLSHLILRWIVKDPKNAESDKYVFGKVDLTALVEEAHNTGKSRLDTEHEIRIFQNALDFSNVKVRDCMVPRPDIIAIEASASIEELLNKFVTTGFSKILVYENSIDTIVGYVSSKELFKNPRSLKSKIIRSSIVPETMNASKLLRLLLQERKSIAVVVDEFGGTSGIVTTEDIMEEIFGEIEDEHDTIEIVEKKLSDNSYILSGRLTIEYVNEHFKLHITESEDYDTLAGYILARLSKIPILNEEFTIDDLNIKILKTFNKRLELIYVKKNNT